MPTVGVFTTTPLGAVPVETTPVVADPTEAVMVPDVMARDAPVFVELSFAKEPGAPRRSAPKTVAATTATTACFGLGAMRGEVPRCRARGSVTARGSESC